MGINPDSIPFSLTFDKGSVYTGGAAESKWEKKMDDKELMGGVLQVLNEKRHNDLTNFNQAFADLGAPANVLRHILSRLEQKGLIDWRNNEVGGLGLGKITDYGIDVVNKETEPPIPMTFTNIHVHGSTNVIIGPGGNIQTNTFEIGKVIAAIDHSSATENEKAAAKGLLQNLSENPLLNSILGKLIRSVA
jgi:DNA-binding IscR family transcriptional regulator